MKRKGTSGRGKSTGKGEAAGKPTCQEGGIVQPGLWHLYLGRSEGRAGVEVVRSTEAKLEGSHDMLLGLDVVGHGNGTEVFKQRDATRSVFRKGHSGTDGGGGLGRQQG